MSTRLLRCSRLHGVQGGQVECVSGQLFEVVDHGGGEMGRLAAITGGTQQQPGTVGRRLTVRIPTAGSQYCMLTNTSILL